MGSYRGPKGRIERRLGVNLFGRKSNILLKKNKVPGMHGISRKKSLYKIGLEEKQKCSFFHGYITQKKLVNILKKSSKNKTLKLSTNGLVGSFAGMLESRLDNVVKRLGLADTTGFARQLISHGKVLVNEKKVDIKSYIIKPGSTISLNEKCRTMGRLKEARARAGKEVPSYLSLTNDFEGTLLKFPEIDSMPSHKEKIVNYAQAIQYLKKHL